ncbi:MAG: 50S ribosomal protein L18 [Candidatus Nanoarchaeia archaeon]|nr:50S ribosomal protein L18 [Candidatus Nanoarchaeia archaeon]
MAKNSIFTVAYRRKREGKTNYKKRLTLLKSNLTRLVIRKTNTEIVLQLVNYDQDGDKVVATVPSKKLIKFGWDYSKKSIPAAYLTGLLLAKMAKTKNVTEAVLDLGLQTPEQKSKVYAALKGAIDGGLNIPADEKVFPDESRIKGEHISKMSDLPLFSKYKSKKLDVTKMPTVFEAVKKKIME